MKEEKVFEKWREIEGRMSFMKNTGMLIPFGVEDARTDKAYAKLVEIFDLLADVKDLSVSSMLGENIKLSR